MMKKDSEDHTRWKHWWGWRSRGSVWDKIEATRWAGRENWMEARRCRPHLVNGGDFGFLEGIPENRPGV